MPKPMPRDPEVLEFIRRTLAFYPASAFERSTAENRELYDRYAAVFRAARPPGVGTEDLTAPHREGGPGIRLRFYRPRQASSRVALLYLHGGGFVLGGLESHDDICAELADATQQPVLAVDYRLAPENLHPAQLDDAEAGLLWLAGRGFAVIACGDSAGGNLAAALCMRRRRCGAPMPLAQVLVYPGLGGDPDRGSYIENAEAPMLSRAECLSYDGVRTGGVSSRSLGDPELTPLSASAFGGLPPAFVVTADIDPLRDDGESYVRRLQDAGIEAKWRNEPELVHGYLRARHSSRRAAESFAAICEAVRHFAGGA
jgi:acetyl esterase